MPLQILHLAGSPTDEFFAELSRLYASDCLAATNDPGRFESFIAYVSPDGRWRFPPSLDRAAIEATPSLSQIDVVDELRDLGIDVMVPQMFCLAGMTVYRRLFELLGIPYVGNRAEVMAVGADKSRARSIVAAAGVDVPEGEILRHGDVPTLGVPAVVKPVNSDNSVGVSLVRDPADFPSAIELALQHCDRVLVERYIELGREVRCGVLVEDGQLRCLPLEEYAVDTERKPIRDRADKLIRDDRGQLVLNAKTAERAWIVSADDPINAPVWEAARRCHDALGCRDYSLFDFRIDPAGRPWFLEAGLYCSFAEQSVISVMAKAAGIDLPELFDTAVRQALRRQPTDT